MRKLAYIILVIAIIFSVWVAIENTYPRLDVTSEYANGEIITHVKAKSIKVITATEIRYKIFFLDQYVNIKPKVQTFSFPHYEESHIWKIQSDLLQGKKNYLQVEVLVTYDDVEHKIVANSIIKNIKEKIYHDLVIEPELKEDKVYYHADGLTAVINKKAYDEEIIFYSYPNSESPNITVGFQKGHALYPLKSFKIVSKTEALENNYEGMTPAEFINKSGLNKSRIVVEYGMIDLIWDGYYPYDSNDNKVYYVGEIGDTEIDFVVDNRVFKASHEKYHLMRRKIPSVTFEIPAE